MIPSCGGGTRAVAPMAVLVVAAIGIASLARDGLRSSGRPTSTLEDHGYDWSRSTSENHQAPSAPFREEFKASRERLDYSWHVRYSLRRQELQDAIVRKMLRESAAACFSESHDEEVDLGVFRGLAARWRRRHGMRAPSQPWAIFTAGCMAAGKTHVMGLLNDNGLLPISSFVRVDLDYIRSQLPETKTYNWLNRRTAGVLTQLEAGAIAEVATEEAFQRGLHVWVDSSLKDERWWSCELRRLRRTYPQYKYCILHVRASWDRVVEREARRGQKTGRRIPPTLLSQVYDAVPRAVAKLQRHVDLCIEVDNDEEQPRLRRAEDVLAFLRLCRKLQPADGRQAQRGITQWRRQQGFAVWRWFDAEGLQRRAADPAATPERRERSKVVRGETV